MMKNDIKLNQLFTYDNVLATNYGIIYFLREFDITLTDPLLTDFLTASNFHSLDTDYLVGFSGEKTISKLLYVHLEKTLASYNIDMDDFVKGNITLTQYTNILTRIFSHAVGNYALVKIIHSRFAYKWKKLWDALTTSYKPLENYAMEEKRTPLLTITGNGSVNSENEISGFNSVDSQNSTKNVATNTSSQTTTGTDTLERTGNIGVTTSQQMLESEFEVRKYDFYKEIYKDIDSILCLKVY